MAQASTATPGKVATHTVEVNGQAFRIRMGWNAIRRIEETTGEPIQHIGFRMINGLSGVKELGVCFWAGLETARLADKLRPHPYSMEEVGDLIDLVGGEQFIDIVGPVITQAVVDAFPPPAKKKPGAGEEAKGPDPSTGTGS